MNRTTKTAILNNEIYSGNGEKQALENFYEPTYYLNNNTQIMAQIQAQNVLTAVHHQFHHNQEKYIDLLSKMVECQATLLEKYQSSPALPKVMQNLEQILQILQINQSHYNISHEGYLQNQLALLREGQFPTNTSNRLNDAPLNRVPNYPITETDPITETETALPTTKLEEQNGSSANQSASSTPKSATPATLPKVPPTLQSIASTSETIGHPVETAKPEEQNDKVRQSASSTPKSATPATLPKVPPTLQPIAITSETIGHAVETAKPEGQNGKARQSASSTPKSATPATLPKIPPTLQPIAITSETIGHPVETAKPEGQNASASQSASSTPKSETAATLPKIPPTLEQVTTISETINYSVESNSSTNVPSTVLVATEARALSTNLVDVTKISNRLLEVVSDKTGYPIDMLDMDMDLEADLGIDSIKQIQIFAAMQDEFPDIEIDTEVIGELRTLAKIIHYLKEYSSADQTTLPSDNLHQEVAIERQLVKKNT